MEEEEQHGFKGALSPTANILVAISLRIAKWALVKKEFANISMNDIFFDWKACTACGVIKEKRVVTRSLLPIGVMEFNEDGKSFACSLE